MATVSHRTCVLWADLENNPLRNTKMEKNIRKSRFGKSVVSKQNAAPACPDRQKKWICDRCLFEVAHRQALDLSRWPAGEKISFRNDIRKSWTFGFEYFCPDFVWVEVRGCCTLIRSESVLGIVLVEKKIPGQFMGLLNITAV